MATAPAPSAPLTSRSISESLSGLLPSSSHSHHQRHPSLHLEKVVGGAAVDDSSSVLVDGGTQLSQDLALFLANPSLRAALADGSLDLASYSSQVDDELNALETKCIGLYREKSGDITQLRSQLVSCRQVLDTLHLMLLGFQEDLSGLSGEIRHLQEKSRDLDVQLRNRRQAEMGLRHFLEHIVIAPSLAQTITTGTVNPIFLQAVEELRLIYKDCFQSSRQLWSCDKEPCETVAGQEMQEQVTTLRLVAISRTRDYFLQQLALLRRPQTNIRMIQVHGLLKYAALQDFLAEACPEVASEILNVYLETMSKTFLQVFRTYQSHLLQLDSTKFTATRQDVIAIEEAVLRDALTTRAKKRVDVFSLGNRASDCLEVEDERHAPILAHVALAEGLRYPYERLYRSLIGHLVDAVTNEHVFCLQFFKREAFAPLFHPTLGLLLEQIENYLFGCYDAVCLLLLIQVTHMYRRILRRRRIRSLDGFLNQITKLLWPRLKSVMDGHLKSIKQGTATTLGSKDAVDERQLLHTHYVSRRFAEFCCSILLILHKSESVRPTPVVMTNQGSPSRRSGEKMSSSLHDASSSSLPCEDLSAKTAGEKLLDDLSVMIDEYVCLLDRLCEELPSQKKRCVFKINNLDHVVCIFQERRVLGKEFNQFVRLLMKERELYVEEELLTTGFSKMIAFVQATEIHLNSIPKGSAPYEHVNASVVESLVLDFASCWKSNIETINRNVLSHFSNFRNGMEILKQVLTQLLLYYTRFHDVIRKVWKNKPPAFCKDLISTNLILAEIKKYALAI
jgi:vacuolar protein sorting-associated protein 52